MDTETMIRNLKCVEEQHKDDKVFTGQLNISQMAYDVRRRLEELKLYEDIGLTPGDIRELQERDNDGWISVETIERIMRNHMNDGWIPVVEPPEDGQTVLCTDGEYVYLVEYDADLDAPFGNMDGITHWQPRPEPYRPVSGTDRPDWRDGMLRKFDRRG